MPPENCAIHEHMLKQLHHEVFGNGKPGLRSSITEVDHKVNTLTTQMTTIITMLKIILAAISPVLLVLLAYFLPKVFGE